MGQATLNGDPPVTIILRRAGRARRVSLRVSGIDGRVTLSVPPGVGDSEALAFAEEKSDWIRCRLAERPPVEPVRVGGSVPVEGRQRAIVTATGRQTELNNDALAVPGAPEMVGPRVAAFLKFAARDRLSAAAERHAVALDRRFGRITLRDPRSRWGSCSWQGNLMFSWRLAMAPPEVLDYVAAHEVAHLAEMNHSRAFWAVVGQLYPDYEAPRGWLRAHGQALHRYRFGD